MLTQKNIALIGLKAAGKTTIGKQLALHLNQPFIDTDTALSQRHYHQTGQQQTAPLIYQHHGATYFHQLEADTVVAILPTTTPTIIATGGSCLLFPNNARHIQTYSSIIYLYLSQNKLLERWQSYAPHFLNNTLKNSSLNDYYNERDPVYRNCANWTINIDQLPPQEIINRIMSLINKDN